MTTSFSVTRDTVIVAALRKLKLIEPNDTITSGTIDPNILLNAQNNFNVMVKQWATEGLKLWTNQFVQVPYQPNQASYTIGPSGQNITSDKPLKIINAYLYNNQITPPTTITLAVLSQQEYGLFGSPGSTGVTNSVYLQVGVTFSTVFVYLTPDTPTSTNYLLSLWVQRPMADINSGGDYTLQDFPSEWYNALVWNLADDMAIEFSVSPADRAEIAVRAKAYRKQLNDWDVEYVSTYFQMDSRGAFLR